MITTVEIVPSTTCPGSRRMLISSPDLATLVALVTIYRDTADATFHDCYQSPDGRWNTLGRITGNVLD